MKKLQKFKEFLISSWAIDNRTTIYLLTFLVVVIGYLSYIGLPKENFPEIQIPTIYIGTPYPGTGPSDMENLVTRKIEKELKSTSGVKKITSNSVQDYSVVVVEFETTVDLKEAKREVQEAVDRAKAELPADIPADPSVRDILLSEIPILFVNVSGDMNLEQIKNYAEDLKDEIESFREINRVEMVGALDKEVQVNVDLYKMEMAGVGFGDIERALASENVIISGGQIDMGTVNRSLRVNAEFQSIEEMENLIVKGVYGNPVFLKDIASVKEGFKDAESFARLDGLPVITLNVIKKSGENLVEASDKITALVDDWKANRFPDELKIKISADQSVNTKRMLSELVNTIIIGFILVTLVLMFFMGLRDSLFVGLSVPLSSLIAFMVIPAMGFTLNMVVLFSFILALGIVVDNAIVVIENTYRIYNSEEDLTIVQAAKKAAGEVIGPVFAGTLTTMAPFIPLTFWDGIIGEFMFFLPITIMITLSASLIVAYVMNPVFAVTFMKREKETKPLSVKSFLILLGFIAAFAVLGYVLGNKSIGNIMIFAIIFAVFYRFLLKPMISLFQDRLVPAMIRIYKNILRWCLSGYKPGMVMLGTVLLLIASIVLIQFSSPKVVFFPEAEPNFVYIYNSLPIGTDINITDEKTREIERRVYEVLGKNNPIVKSVISNVAIGAGDQNDFNRNSSPHKSKVSIEFVEFKKRGELSTAAILEEIRTKMKGISGTQITVDKESSGPPTAKPVNIEVSAEDLDDLINGSSKLMKFLDSINVAGVEELKWDLELNKPEVLIDIDRTKASELGISSAQIGMALRTSVFGKEASKYRVNEDEYPIQIRLDKKYRDNLPALLNQKLIFRNMSDGKIYNIPMSAVADISYVESFGGINRLDMEKVVTIYSNILTGYNANEVVEKVRAEVGSYVDKGSLPAGVKVNLTGEAEEQAETGAFLLKAFLAAFLLIILVLVTQFNSIGKVLIILFQIVLSLIGVFLGFALTGMDMSLVMVGVGIISLAGVVVNNGIILLDFIQIMKDRGMTTRTAIIEGGSTRFTPVILTASSTILGLIPMAFAFNLNFGTLISDLNPQIFVGGDNAAFWGPLAWTIIFGLTFATIITLIVVPVMYYLMFAFQMKASKLWKRINS